MNQNTSIGEKIKALRTSQNLTLKQLGEMTNLSTGFLSQMERGLSSIAIDTLETIAGVLGVSLSSFFNEEPHAGLFRSGGTQLFHAHHTCRPSDYSEYPKPRCIRLRFSSPYFYPSSSRQHGGGKPGDVQPFRGRIHLYTGRYCDDPVGVDSVYALSGRQYPDSF